MLLMQNNTEDSMVRQELVPSFGHGVELHRSFPECSAVKEIAWGKTVDRWG